MYLTLLVFASKVEEVRQKDAFVDEVVEKKIPQVKAMYPYSGQGLEVAKGEVRTRFYAICFKHILCNKRMEPIPSLP